MNFCYSKSEVWVSNKMLVMFFWLTLAFHIRLADSSQYQLRSYTNEGVQRVDHHSSRELPTLTQPPSNDECTSAIIIPSKFPGLTYTTASVSITNATYGSGRPLDYCSLANHKDVWYQFTPATTSSYDLSFDLGNTEFGILLSIDTPACNDASPWYCSRSSSVTKFIFKSNTTYFIYAQPVVASTNGTMQLTLRRHIAPSNNLCTGATMIHPTNATAIVTANTTYAIYDPTAETSDYACSVMQSSPTFWYKYSNPSNSPISIDISIKHNKAVGFIPYIALSQILIFQGTNCTNLQCVGTRKAYGGKISYDFIAAGQTSYYILLQASPVNSRNYTYTAVINGRTNFFSTVDSETDKELQLLKHIDYYAEEYEPTSEHINFRAIFDAPPKSIKSVLMTFDNPKRNYCDTKAPYSTFGDTNGNYWNATIPLGRHRITATPYAQSNCTGKAGTTIAQNFNVSGCLWAVSLVDSVERDIFMYPFISNSVSTLLSSWGQNYSFSLSCQVKIIVASRCDFPVKTVRTELRNATTNKLIHVISHTIDGSDTISTDIIGKGSYTLTSIINNVTHPSVYFTVVNTTNCMP